MLYFDAAFIAKFYLQEPDSEAVRALASNDRRLLEAAPHFGLQAGSLGSLSV